MNTGPCKLLGDCSRRLMHLQHYGGTVRDAIVFRGGPSLPLRIELSEKKSPTLVSEDNGDSDACDLVYIAPRFR